MATSDSTTPAPAQPMSAEAKKIAGELDPIEKRIRKSEGESIADRWKFGRILTEQRKGKKQLPTGLRAEIEERFGLEASEITRRMQLADTFPTREQVVDASTRCGGSWRRVISEVLTKNPRQPAPKTFAKAFVAAASRLETKAADARMAELTAEECETARTALAKVIAALEAAEPAEVA